MYHCLPKILEGQTLLATGIIVSIPEYQPRQIRFDFLITDITSPQVGFRQVLRTRSTTENSSVFQYPIHYPLKVRLSGYRYSHINKHFYLQKGEVWQFAIRLKRPRGFWSPGSFDYQAELFQQNIQATGYIVNRFPSHLIKAANFYYVIDHWREEITHRVKKSLKDDPLQGLINALTTGVRYGITDAQWQVMRGTGTNHLFAISGLHLAFIAGIIYFLTHFFYCRIPYAVLVIPASQVSAGLTMVFAIFYAALAGFALPIQRALLMLLVFCGQISVDEILLPDMHFIVLY